MPEELVGAEAVANAAPDGYTLLFGTIGPLVISPSANTLRYDPAKDFAPVGQVYRSAQVFSANPGLGKKTVPEFLSYAKDNPGKATIGTAGIGTLPHLTTELLKRDAAVNVTHVPYRGTNAALADLIGGQIDAIFGEVSVMAPNVQSGKAVALAITSPERSKLLPSVPTMNEVGMPSLTIESWGGLLVPARVPADVLAHLEMALQKALREPSFRDAAEKQGWSSGHRFTQGFCRTARKRDDQMEPDCQVARSSTQLNDMAGRDDFLGWVSHCRGAIGQQDMLTD